MQDEADEPASKSKCARQPLERFFESFLINFRSFSLENGPQEGTEGAEGTQDTRAQRLSRRRTVRRHVLDRYERYMTVGALCAAIVPLCFMCLVPSFLRSRGGAVTRIY